WLKEAGVPIEDAANLLRHSTMDLTRKVYQDTRLPHLAAQVERISCGNDVATPTSNLRGHPNLRLLNLNVRDEEAAGSNPVTPIREGVSDPQNDSSCGNDVANELTPSKDHNNA